MKVAFVADDFEVRGGAEQYAHRVEELLASRDHDVRRVVAGEDFGDADVAFVQNVADVGVLERLVDSLPTVQFLHDYRWTSPSETRFWRRDERICERRFGLGCVAHGYVDHCRNRRPDRIVDSQRRVSRWLRLQGRLARIVVASQYVADVTVAEGVERASIDVLPYFVESVEAVDLPRASPPTIVYVGRLAQAKGVHVLIRAASKLAGLCRVVVVGDGYYRARLEALAAQERGDVTFAGWLGVPERNAIVSRASVLAMPSLWPECFGLAGLEALATGTPVVASSVGGIPEWLDASAGTLVPAGDVTALAAVLELRLAPPSPERVAAGRAVAARYSPQRHVERLEAILSAAGS